MSHLSQFKEALEKNGFDAAIVSQKTNQRYLSEFDFDDGLVLVTKGQSYLITDFRYVEAAKALAAELGVAVADAYAKWKALEAEGSGVDCMVFDEIDTGISGRMAFSSSMARTGPGGLAAVVSNCRTYLRITFLRWTRRECFSKRESLKCSA